MTAAAGNQLRDEAKPCAGGCGRQGHWFYGLCGGKRGCKGLKLCHDCGKTIPPRRYRCDVCRVAANRRDFKDWRRRVKSGYTPPTPKPPPKECVKKCGRLSTPYSLYCGGAPGCLGINHCLDCGVRIPPRWWRCVPCREVALRRNKQKYLRRRAAAKAAARESPPAPAPAPPPPAPAPVACWRCGGWCRWDSWVGNLVCLNCARAQYRPAAGIAGGSI